MGFFLGNATLILLGKWNQNQKKLYVAAFWRKSNLEKMWNSSGAQNTTSINFPACFCETFIELEMHLNAPALVIWQKNACQDFWHNKADLCADIIGLVVWWFDQ